MGLRFVGAFEAINEHPFRGLRDSGSSFSEQSLESLRFYTGVKTAAVKSA